MNSPLERVAVLSYSARALAQAAASLGLGREKILALDAFGDLDTREASTCVVLQDWGSARAEEQIKSSVDDFFSSSADEPRVVLCGGGTENWPSLLKQLQHSSTPLSPKPEALSHLRSWNHWQGWALTSGILFPNTYSAAPQQHCGDLLSKNKTGSGGLGISRVPCDTRPTSPDRYYQEFLSGRPIGVNLAIGPNSTRFLGAFESLDSEFSFGPLPFIYRGSRGPVAIDDVTVSKLVSLGNRISSDTSYTGLLGVDMIQVEGDALYLLELNPRWTASMELLPSTTGTNALNELLQIHQFSTNHSPQARERNSFATKAIYYAKSRGVLSEKNRTQLQEYLTRETSLSKVSCNLHDLPAAAPFHFDCGEPVFSAIAFAEDIAKTDEVVKSLFSFCDRLFGPI